MTALVVSAAALGACSTGEKSATTTVRVVPVSNIVVLTSETTTTTPAGGVGGSVTTLAGTGGGTTVAPATSTTLAPTTVPASGRTVIITQGEFNTSPSGAHCLNQCKYVDIQISGFNKGETVTITCYANVGSSGPYIKTADRTGSLHSTTACFFGNVANVYVTVNEVTSNVVAKWKDW